MATTEETQTQKQPGILKKIALALDSVSFGLGKEREYLLENVSMLALGGMPVLDALHAVREELKSRAMRRTLDELIADIESGSPLWKAFDRAKLFKEHTVSLVRIGEESGKLADNLKLIARQEAKERDFQSKIRSAMLYPVFVLSLTLIVGVLIAWFILPKLANVFSQLNVELPTVTRWLIGAGAFLSEYGHIALPVFVAVLVLIVFIVFFYSKTKFIGQSFLFSAPGIHGLIREVELSRLGYLLGTLLQAGVPVVQALDSLEKATAFPHYKKLYAHLRESVADGNSFQRSLEGYPKVGKVIPAPIQQLIAAGEHSGHLPETLLTINSTYEARTEQTTKNISVILEPVLLVIVWLGVVAVALAVILPIYSLIGGLNTDPSSRVETPNETPIEPDPEGVSVVPEVLVRAGKGAQDVFDEPAPGAEVVGNAEEGVRYEYSDQVEGWYEVVLPDESTGWIEIEYVDVVSG